MCYRLNGYHAGFCIWISWKKLKFILQFVAKEWKGWVQGTFFFSMSCGIYSPFKNLWCIIYIYISRSIFNDNHHLLSDHCFYVKVTSKLTPIIWYLTRQLKPGCESIGNPKLEVLVGSCLIVLLILRDIFWHFWKMRFWTWEVSCWASMQVNSFLRLCYHPCKRLEIVILFSLLDEGWYVHC